MRKTGGFSFLSNWKCAKCTVENKGNAKKCKTCGEPKGGQKVLTGIWACPTCTVHNPATSKKCATCGKNRPENVKSIADVQLE